MVTSHANPPLGLLHAAVTTTLQNKILISSLEPLLTQPRCVPLYNLLQSSTTFCDELAYVCMNLCCCNRLHYLAKCCFTTCVWTKSFKKPLFSFLPSFLPFSCAEKMWSFQLQSRCQKLTPMCRVQTHSELHVQWLWGSVSGLVWMFNVRQKRRQTASKATRTSTKLFHEHQSFKTSSSIHLFLHPSMSSASLWFCTHAYTVTTVEVLGQWDELGHCSWSSVYLLWKQTDGEKHMETVRCSCQSMMYYDVQNRVLCVYTYYLCIFQLLTRDPC